MNHWTKTKTEPSPDFHGMRRATEYARDGHVAAKRGKRWIVRHRNGRMTSVSGKGTFARLDAAVESLG